MKKQRILAIFMAFVLTLASVIAMTPNKAYADIGDTVVTIQPDSLAQGAHPITVENGILKIDGKSVYPRVYGGSRLDTSAYSVTVDNNVATVTCRTGGGTLTFEYDAEHAFILRSALGTDFNGGVQIPSGTGSVQGATPFRGYIYDDMPCFHIGAELSNTATGEYTISDFTFSNSVGGPYADGRDGVDDNRITSMLAPNGSGTVRFTLTRPQGSATAEPHITVTPYDANGTELTSSGISSSVTNTYTSVGGRHKYFVTVALTNITTAVNEIKLTVEPESAGNSGYNLTTSFSMPLVHSTIINTDTAPYSVDGRVYYQTQSGLTDESGGHLSGTSVHVTNLTDADNGTVTIVASLIPVAGCTTNPPQVILPGNYSNYQASENYSYHCNNIGSETNPTYEMTIQLAGIGTTARDNDGNLINSISFTIEPDNSGAQQQLNTVNAQINLVGPAGEWSDVPMVRENYDVVGDDVNPCSAPYAKYCYVASIGINDGERTNHMQHYDKNYDITGLDSQTITYNREDTDSFVQMTICTAWSDRIETIKVNGVEYPVPFDYDNRNEWLNQYGGQNMEFDIRVPVSTRIASNGDEIYDVELKARPITETECYVGNFLWSNDEADSPEALGYYNDAYIGHSDLELLAVTFNDGDGSGDKTYTIDELRNPDGTNRFSYVDVGDGSMLIPEGAWVTMRIEPEYGYQVVDFDINGTDSIEWEDTSVFRFKIGKGNFHIGAHVEPVADQTVVDSDAVGDVDLDLEDGILDYGTAKLSVEDVNLTDEKKTAFSEVASEEGLEISDYVDISMDQVFYKGTGNSNDAWVVPMETLSGDATIALDLENVSADDDVVIIHNIHDGSRYETINAVYDKNLKKFVFKTDSFSNYAIAIKKAGASTTDATTAANATTDAATAKAAKAAKAPGTGDDSLVPYIVMLAVSVGGVSILSRKRKFRR